jgi:hypothetical protein
MLNLYKVTFQFRTMPYRLQPVIVSESNRIAAVKRARAFIETQYKEPVRFETVDKICRTPDDVLDWA